MRERQRERLREGGRERERERYTFNDKSEIFLLKIFVVLVFVNWDVRVNLAQW